MPLFKMAKRKMPETFEDGEENEQVFVVKCASKAWFLAGGGFLAGKSKGKGKAVKGDKEDKGGKDFENLEGGKVVEGEDNKDSDLCEDPLHRHRRHSHQEHHGGGPLREEGRE